MKSIVIIGATSSIAEHCARLWVTEPVRLLLIGRNQNKLNIISHDLKVRSPSSEIEIIVNELISVEAIKEIMTCVSSLSQHIDTVLIAHGVLPDQEHCQSEIIACRESLEINALSPVLILEAFANIMHAKNGGNIAIIGSVAGDRGRRSNYIYGAAKGMIEKYVQGMQHRFANTDLHISLIKPGPTDTPMTMHLKSSKLKFANVDLVAKEIVSGIEKNKRIIYTPKKWKYLMLIIKSIPFFIFKNMNI